MQYIDHVSIWVKFRHKHQKVNISFLIQYCIGNDTNQQNTHSLLSLFMLLLGAQSQVVHKILMLSFVKMWCWTVMDMNKIYRAFLWGNACLCVCKRITLFMNCDRFHTFWSIFTQSSRLTVDFLIYFISHLRL